VKEERRKEKKKEKKNLFPCSQKKKKKKKKKKNPKSLSFFSSLLQTSAYSQDGLRPQDCKLTLAASLSFLPSHLLQSFHEE